MSANTDPVASWLPNPTGAPGSWDPVATWDLTWVTGTHRPLGSRTRRPPKLPCPLWVLDLGIQNWQQRSLLTLGVGGVLAILRPAPYPRLHLLPQYLARLWSHHDQWRHKVPLKLLQCLFCFLSPDKGFRLPQKLEEQESLLNQSRDKPT
jgi:hypothetical protein